MKKKITAIIIAACMICMLSPTAFAADDTTPPALTGTPSINQTDFNVGDTLVITIPCSDPESGLDAAACRISFQTAYEGLAKDIWILHCTPVDGGIQGSYTFQNEDYEGVYNITCVSLWDMDGNAHAYESYNDAIPNISFTFHNGYIPPKGPDITSFKLSKLTARVGDTITYTITASDPSGVVSASLNINLTWIGWYYYKKYPVVLSPVPGKAGTLSGTFTVTPDIPNGDYYPIDISVTSGAGITTTYRTWSDLYTANQSCDNMVLKVINYNVPAPRDNPTVLSYTISSHRLTQGQQLTVTAQVDPKYSRLTDLCMILIGKESNTSAGGIYLSAKGNGLFTGSKTIPIGAKPGTYVLEPYIACIGNEWGSLECCTSLKAKTPYDYVYLKGSELTVDSLMTISGTENISIPVGSTFDAMQGVSVTNALTGDMMDMVTVTGGSFDTSQPGMHLIRYRICGTINIDGTGFYINHTDYRWVGVTEIPVSDDAEGVLAVTVDSLSISGGGNDVNIQKDGKAIAFTTQLSDPGEYTLSPKGELNASQYVAYGASTGKNETVKAVIDNKGPQISASSKLIAPNSFKVIVDAKDPSGISETKYLPGSATLADCKAYGTAFIETFTTGIKGKYTIYARDRFGYESSQVIDISKTLVSYPYLYSLSTDKGSWNRAFTYNYYKYTVYLGEFEEGVTITPVKADMDATMTIQGQSVTSRYIPVSNGRSIRVPIKIKSGRLSKTYYVTVRRAPSTNNNLTGLNVSAGGLTYDAATQTYTLQLDKDTASVRVTPIKESSLAKVSPGAKTYKLRPGQEKKYKITVTAQSRARKVYWLVIKRAIS